MLGTMFRFFYISDNQIYKKQPPVFSSGGGDTLFPDIRLNLLRKSDRNGPVRATFSAAFFFMSFFLKQPWVQRHDKERIQACNYAINRNICFN